jgi:hypothetical protein
MWRAAIAVLIGWAPLAVLTIIPAIAMRDERVESFLFDFSVYARSLIAVPLFILAESICLLQLGGIAHRFLDVGLVPDAERDRYYDAVAFTRRLLDSRVAEVVTLVLAYTIIVVLIR